MMKRMKQTKKIGLLAPERGEPKRSAGGPNGGANNPAASAALPNPEVSTRPQRRRFTAAYKLSIVEEAQRCTDHGQIGALLRREGLYSSALTLWRRQYQQGARQGLLDDNRGRKPVRSAQDQETQRLRQEVERLTQKLQQAELIIDIQKKVAAIFGSPSTMTPNSGDNS